MKSFKKTLAALAVASSVGITCGSAYAIGLDSIDNMLDQTAISGRTDIDLSQSTTSITIDNLKIAAGNFLDNDGEITATVSISGGSITAGLTAVPESVTMTAIATATPESSATSSATAVASTANLASSIAATAVGAMNTGSVTVETALLQSTLASSGESDVSSIAQVVPMINAHNLVSNEANILASVELKARSWYGDDALGNIALGLTNVTATALGAVNTGSITVRAGLPSLAQ